MEGVIAEGEMEKDNGGLSADGEVEKDGGLLGGIAK
jgi:hypothetical protein